MGGWRRRRVTDCYPSDRNPLAGCDHAAYVDSAAEGDAAGAAHHRPVEDHPSGRYGYIVFVAAAGEVGGGTDQHMIADRDRVAPSAAHDRALHITQCSPMVTGPPPAVSTAAWRTREWAHIVTRR